MKQTNERTNRRQSMQTNTKNVLILACFAHSNQSYFNEREKQTSRLFSLIYIKLFCLLRTSHPISPPFAAVWPPCRQSNNEISCGCTPRQVRQMRKFVVDTTMTISLRVFISHYTSYTASNYKVICKFLHIKCEHLIIWHPLANVPIFFEMHHPLIFYVLSPKYALNEKSLSSTTSSTRMSTIDFEYFQSFVIIEYKSREERVSFRKYHHPLGVFFFYISILRCGSLI